MTMKKKTKNSHRWIGTWEATQGYWRIREKHRERNKRKNDRSVVHASRVFEAHNVLDRAVDEDDPDWRVILERCGWNMPENTWVGRQIEKFTPVQSFEAVVWFTTFDVMKVIRLEETCNRKYLPATLNQYTTRCFLVSESQVGRMNL